MRQVLLFCWLLLAAAAAAQPSLLHSCYLEKYLPQERESARRGLAAVLPGWAPRVAALAVEDILTYHRIIFHTSARHDILKNLAVVNAWRPTIVEMCRRYGVPVAPVEAIITWENSGGVNVGSPAGCVGVGQLSMGAVERSHLLVPGLEHRHRLAARMAHVQDERTLPACNIEDTVIFYRNLLDHYGGRADLAIAAYHNGEGNTDDLVRVWLHRHRPDLLGVPITESAASVSYWDLWTDPYVREIMAGLRTMEGEPLNDSNGGAMLGDESDIYLWKVLGAYGAFLGPVEDVASVVDRWAPAGEVTEVEGLNVYLTSDSIRRDLSHHVLVFEHGQVMLPETAAFVRWLERQAAVPVRLGTAVSATPAWASLSGVPVFSPGGCVHQTGASVDILLGSDPSSRALDRLLNQLYTTDRIYRTSLPGGRCRVTLNPRYATSWDPPPAP